MLKEVCEVTLASGFEHRFGSAVGEDSLCKLHKRDFACSVQSVATYYVKHLDAWIDLRDSGEVVVALVVGAEFDVAVFHKAIYIVAEFITTYDKLGYQKLRIIRSRI